MLYSRSRIQLYVLYLRPHTNLLTIEKIRQCSINGPLNRSSLAFETLNLRNGFRTKASETSSNASGRNFTIGKLDNGSDDKQSKFSFFHKFNSGYREQLKTMLDAVKGGEDEKSKIKIAFAEGYLAAIEKGDKKRGLFFWSFDSMAKVWLLVSVVVFIGMFYFQSGSFRKIFVGHRHEIMPEEITVTFGDALGIDEAKSELKEIVEFLRDPERFSKLGGRLPRGVLLVGEPGTGKTLLARAVAGEAGVPFFHTSGSEFDEILVGQGARRIRDLFEAAKSRSPCVIFIDEIDSVGGKRTNSVLHPYANQTINQLLNEMDGFHQNEGVIVLGATNRRNDLDSALLRPGRFDVEVNVAKPDLVGRKEILTYYLNKLKTAKDINVEVLAKRTLGLSGADLENICNQAALRAAIDDRDCVTMEHLEHARDKVSMGPEKKRKIPDTETNRLTAYHEAGHTLVAFYNENAHPVHKVTIVPRGQALGVTHLIPEKEQYHQTKAMMLAQLDTLMGGRVAEELVFGEDKLTSGAYSDLQKATDIATAMVKNFGMSDRVGLAVHDNDNGMYNKTSSNTLEVIEQEVKRLLNESYERAKSTLKTHSKEHHLLAEALLRYETLDLDQIRQVIGKSPNSKIG